MKNNKGITLIALVITIIVLLILAAVSIGMLYGDSGVLSQSTSSRDTTNINDTSGKIDLVLESFKLDFLSTGKIADRTYTDAASTLKNLEFGTTLPSTDGDKKTAVDNKTFYINVEKATTDGVTTYTPGDKIEITTFYEMTDDTIVTIKGTILAKTTDEGKRGTIIKAEIVD